LAAVRVLLRRVAAVGPGAIHSFLCGEFGAVWAHFRDMGKITGQICLSIGVSVSAL
jgi:hypothetical protein